MGERRGMREEVVDDGAQKDGGGVAAGGDVGGCPCGEGPVWGMRWVQERGQGIEGETHQRGILGSLARASRKRERKSLLLRS